MNLQLKNQLFLVCGASSGFGHAIAEQLLAEKASVIAVARREEKLEKLGRAFPGKVQAIVGDISTETTQNEIENTIRGRQLHGALINAGGPPALSTLETSMSDWDEAYASVMRWKIELTLRLVPHFLTYKYGRILFIESQSVKQPLTSLALSNSFRAGVVGFAKTLALEVAPKGITINTMAPGSHNTPAIERVLKKQMEQSGKSYEDVKKAADADIPVGRMGEARELASLATWLLSPVAGFVTGQTISHDGGNVRGLFG